MSVEKIYDGSEYKEVEVEDSSSNTIQEIVYSWKNNPDDFHGAVKQVKSDPTQKIKIGDVVFEKRGGKYILRKSSNAY